MPNKEINEWASQIAKDWFTNPHPCFCVGRQNGEPVCPCRMRHVKIVGGRYVYTQDLGPVIIQVDQDATNE